MRISLTWALLLCVSISGYNQPENRKLLAHYPLMGDLIDATGQNDDLTVSEIDIRDSALYSDGANSFSDTANRIFGRFPTLDLDDIYFSLEFSLDSIPNDNLGRSVIVGGSGWRWLSALYDQPSKQIRFGYNNFTQAPGTFNYNYDTWYELVITYQRSTQTGRMLIDGQEVASAEFDLDANNDRSMVLDCFCGRHAMGGFWRNLRVYGRDTSFVPLQVQCNVVQHVSTKDISDGKVAVEITAGIPPFQVRSVMDGDTISRQIDTSVYGLTDLGAGTLDVQVTDQAGITENCVVELIAPQTDLAIISHFPLTNNLEDVLGTHEEISINNVALIEGEGLFSEGLSPAADTFNQIQGFLGELDVNEFYISLDVKLDSITGDPGRNEKNIFIAGLGWRWLSPIYFQGSQVFGLSYNNSSMTITNFDRFEYDRWYEVAVSYDAATDILAMFIDRQEILRDTVDLDTNNDRSFGLWCNCGPQPMRGYWKDLRIYGPGEMTTSSTNQVFNRQFSIFPNPTKDVLTIDMIYTDSDNTPIHVYRSDGVLHYSLPMVRSGTDVEINVNTWPSGIYFIRVGNSVRTMVKS